MKAKINNLRSACNKKVKELTKKGGSDKVKFTWDNKVFISFLALSTQLTQIGKLHL